METSWLEDFLAVAKHANFSRAAALRNMTQPALSRRIQNLEAWVGAPLFSRDTHQIGLTQAGERLLPMAEEVLRQLHLGREEAQEAAADAATTLHFLSTHALSLTFFPDWLASFGHEDLPGPISLIADTMEGCEQRMLEGTANFLLCHAHPMAPTLVGPPKFLAHPLGTDRLMPVAAPDGHGRPRYTLPGSASAPLPLLAFSAASGMGRILASSHIIEEKGGALKTAFTSHSASLLKSLALDGRGIAWTPGCLTNEDLAAGRLQRAGGPEYDVEIQIQLVRPRSRQTRAAEAFWEHIKARS